MTRTMYDSVTAPELPRGAEMVAGYVDGRYAWSAADWELFPDSEKVRVAVRASTDSGDVIDCETGDATPAEAAAWVRMRRAAGLHRPTVYCDLSEVPAVRHAAGSLVLGRDWDLWVASWDGSASGPYPGAAAKQYRSTAAYDVSAVYDDGWPHRTAPVTTTTVEVDLSKLPELRQGSTGQQVQNWQGILVAHGLGYMIADPAGGNVMQRAGIDGRFGAKTAIATTRFQGEAGLPRTGTVDAATWQKALG